MAKLGRFYVQGNAKGRALVLSAPLSFWGGLDVETGNIIDRSHPNLGQCIAGRILLMPGGRGSSSSSSVLAEALRQKTGPIGIIMTRPDPIVTVGAIVAQSLYGLVCPVVVCDIAGIASGEEIEIASAQIGSGAEIRFGWGM